MREEHSDTCIDVLRGATCGGHGDDLRGGGVSGSEHDIQGLHPGLHLAREADGRVV